MTQHAETFIQRLIDGPSLRADFQRDPRATARREGLALSDTDLRALQSLDWGDDELVARVGSRSAIGSCTTSDVNQKENIRPVRWDR